jgi:general secretion pathway protein L
VSLAIVRRELVDTAIAELQSAGLRVRHARIDDPQGGHEDRLSASASRSPKRGKANQLSLLLAAVTICLLATDACIRIAHQHAVIEGLSNQAAELHASAAQVSLVRFDVEACKHRIEFLVTQRSQASLGAILAKVTQLLPDGTWLYSMDFDGHQLQLQGYSTDASSLVARFDASALFSGAAFRAPMTQGPLPSLQQFDLSMNLSGGS